MSKPSGLLSGNIVYKGKQVYTFVPKGVAICANNTQQLLLTEVKKEVTGLPHNDTETVSRALPTFTQISLHHISAPGRDAAVT